MSRLPPVDLKNVDVSAILKELQGLRYEVREIRLLQDEVKELRQKLQEVDQLKQELSTMKTNLVSQPAKYVPDAHSHSGDGILTDIASTCKPSFAAVAGVLQSSGIKELAKPMKQRKVHQPTIGRGHLTQS